MLNRTALIVVAMLLMAVTACGKSDSPDGTPPPGSTPTPAPTVQSISDEGRAHVAEGSAVTYKNTPPSSGPHYSRLLIWQAYPQEQPEGYWVHNLEHGGVVVLYNCPAGCKDTQAKLEGLYGSLKKGKYGVVKLVVLPYSKLKTPIAVVAWGRQMDLQTPDQNAINMFYNAHVDKGPEDAP